MREGKRILDLFVSFSMPLILFNGSPFHVHALHVSHALRAWRNFSPLVQNDQTSGNPLDPVRNAWLALTR